MRPDVLGSLEDIIEAIGFIEEDTAGLALDGFLADRRARNLVERHFTVVGEAIGRLQRHAPDIADRITSAQQIVDFRNVVVHGYDVIDYRRVWFIINEMLPTLRSEVERILSEAADDPPT
jgi:uncharacterized protein with HEPN domain